MSGVEREAGAASPDWRVVDGHYPGFRNIEGPSFLISCVMQATDLTFEDGVRREEELQLICTAVNAHADLLAALEGLLSHALIGSTKAERADRIAAARSALAKAKGPAPQEQQK